MRRRPFTVLISTSASNSAGTTTRTEPFTVEKRMSSALGSADIRATTPPFTVVALTGPVLVATSTRPLTVCASTSAAASVTDTAPLTELTPIFTPRGSLTVNSTETSSRRPPFQCESMFSMSQWLRVPHSAQIVTSLPSWRIWNVTSSGSPRR